MILDEQQARILSGTAASDDAGNALVLHHGTLHRFDRFERTEDFGFHFGTLEQAQRRLSTMTKEERQKEGAGEPRIVSVALSARNPLILPHDPKHWGAYYMSQILERFLTRAERVTLKRVAPGHPTEGQIDYREGQAIIKGALKRAGHDSILYRNRYENAGPRGSVEWSWLALDPRMIVHLGENLEATAAAFPAGFSAGRAADPEEYVRKYGGLRTRKWELAKVKDIRLFHAAATAVIEEACGPLKWAHNPIEKGTSSAFKVFGALSLRFEIEGETGGLSVKAMPKGVFGRLLKREPVESIVASLGDQSAFEELLDRLQDESDVMSRPYQVGRDGKPDLLTQGILHVTWHPGEPVDVVIGRLKENLGPLVDGLREIAEHDDQPKPAM